MLKAAHPAATEKHTRSPCPFACCLLLAGLKKKLRDLMGEFSGLRARIHEENRQVVQRRVYTVTGQHLPEEDIDTMIETGGHGCIVCGRLAGCTIVLCMQQGLDADSLGAAVHA
eukprot:GHRQ01037746.1.p3 GENE.GHRQ01037746.1~~GHRQ01037746.1.p3  ORF type:complete len:114 (-),score=33.17 GHRQ01037746.1:170-511(-)